MNRYFFILPTLALFLFVSTPVFGAEIQYGQVEDVRGSDIHIQYRGPSGEQNFVCDVVSFVCEDYATSTPALFPQINGEIGYSKSPDGQYGITKTMLRFGDNNATYIYTLYDISQGEARAVGFVPYFENVNSYRFSWGGEHVMLFGVDGSVVTYDILKAEKRKIKPSQSGFSMRSISPYASYLSSYNFVGETHRIWNTKTGELIEVPSQTPNFVEFSQDERFAAFVDDSEGYDTLHLADLQDASDTGINSKRVFEDNFTVEDYIFFNNDLYAVGNTESNPYDWVLYRYNVLSGESEIVARDVSYASYMRPVGEYGVAFLKIEGRNTNVAIYNPTTGNVQVLEPVEPSPALGGIERSVVSFDRAKGVLYEPTRPNRHSNLFVWLHGGPKRQASFGYHSYLSYAVYDELLERLAENGNYILKLDYTGSFGHGNEFMEGLTNNLGVSDTEDVIDASSEIQNRFNIDRTYLIGNSYGGYLGPKALVEAPDQFDGVVAINGVFDWFTLLERIPSSPFSSYFQGSVNLSDLDDNFDLYKRASISKKLSDLEDQNILLIYGENDGTVPTWQTREFFYLAESLGKDVSLLKIEGEGHIIRNRENLNLMCEFIADGLSIENLNCG